MERFLCLDCSSLVPLNIRGNCSTCGSVAVVSEHAHQTAERWPGYVEWLMDAEQTLAMHEAVRFSLQDSKVLAGMGIKV